MTELLLIALALAILVAAAGAWSQRQHVTIYPGNTGLLYRDGRFVRELPPGRYGWWNMGTRSRVLTVPTLPLPVTVPEMSVLSRDQFAFRLVLVPVVAVQDARLFAESQPIAAPPAHLPELPLSAAHPALRPLLAAAALEETGRHMLADLIAEPQPLVEAIAARLADALPGAAIPQVLLTAINLPPETRKMFTDVARAKVEAQAALERARGEQAALRVLANAARLVTDNPALANLRLLQAIEATKGATTIVLGDGALKAAARPD
ncbi:SPFH domain-containing protein [Sphingomonas jatrophae]|uniref:Regulator of protease activity HflC, stomatin/prohibitin superfamily n=1 Tax=Sphingomonas jatrophae TaxID=1166337 RepID=A0A1I6K1R8_9SPHN|nr:SPFH domain-containing protein [Sphingomonas jatrophae]SFR85048.1 Regulator of protease activity HflC, stomatin/prohibitin superfamily [Sphingomonas jatrophae]